MQMKQVVIKNIAYGIIDTLSRKKAKTHVWMKHEMHHFEIMRASDCSVSLFNRKEYRLIGTYEYMPTHGDILKGILNVCQKNQIEVVK